MSLEDEITALVTEHGETTSDPTQAIDIADRDLVTDILDLLEPNPWGYEAGVEMGWKLAHSYHGFDLPEPGSLMDTHGLAFNRESYFRQ